MSHKIIISERKIKIFTTVFTTASIKTDQSFLSDHFPKSTMKGIQNELKMTQMMKRQSQQFYQENEGLKNISQIH